MSCVVDDVLLDLHSCSYQSGHHEDSQCSSALRNCDSLPCHRRPCRGNLRAKLLAGLQGAEVHSAVARSLFYIGVKLSERSH